MHGTQTVVLTEPKEYKGTTYAAGTYQVPVDGRYFSRFTPDGRENMLSVMGPIYDTISKIRT